MGSIDDRQSEGTRSRHYLDGKRRKDRARDTCRKTVAPMGVDSDDGFGGDTD